MEEEKDMKEVEKETQAFLEGATQSELRRLLEHPALTRQVLEAAAESEAVSRAVDAVLDTEFQEMPPAQQERINRLSAKLARKYVPKPGGMGAKPGWLTQQWRIVAAGARQFLGPEPSLVMGAHQKSEPGWPFVVSTAPSSEPEARLEFDLLGVDLVVTNVSGSGGPVIIIECKTGDCQAVSVKPGEKRSLGDIEEFRLTDSSDKDAIAQALEQVVEIKVTFDL